MKPNNYQHSVAELACLGIFHIFCVQCIYLVPFSPSQAVWLLSNDSPASCECHVITIHNTPAVPKLEGSEWAEEGDWNQFMLTSEIDILGTSD